MKRILTLLAIAATHLVLTKALTAVTVTSVSAHALESRTSLVTSILVSVTKILSFPIITLSLYSRQWYPGDLIYIPFALNSLIWAVVTYCVILLIKHIRR
ncbi:MAG: hypothetical protein V3S89_14115 [Desulfobacterales bacterium]